MILKDVKKFDIVNKCIFNNIKYLALAPLLH